MPVQIWQATRKARVLIKLVTHYNNMNAHYTNLTYDTHTNTQYNRTNNQKEIILIYQIHWSRIAVTDGISEHRLSAVHYYAALLPRRGPHIVSHCLSVCLSVRPVIVTERHVAPPSELQWHTCTFRHALRAAYRTVISAAQILVYASFQFKVKINVS